MQVSELVAFLAPLVGRLVEEDTSGEARADALWDCLAPGVISRPFLRDAILALAANPDDQAVRERVARELNWLLMADGALATELDRRWRGESTPAPVPATDEVLEEADGAFAFDRAPPSPSPATAVPTSEPRCIAARFLEHDPAEPLRSTDTYTFALGVSPDELVLFDEQGVFFDEGVFAPGEELVELAVVLLGGDFRIHSPTVQLLRVPRTGRSRNRAYFDVQPLRPGVLELTAALFKSNNFVQGLTLRVNVETGQGAIAGVEPLGRPLEGAFAIQPRNLSLIFTERDQGYDVVMVGPVVAEGFLPVKAEQLHGQVAQVRQSLQEVVNLGVGRDGAVESYLGSTVPTGVELVYQTQIEIPDVAAHEGLRRLAVAGYRLYRQLFYEHGHPSAQLLGDRLREMAERSTLKIQIVSHGMPVPWGMIYLSDDYPEEPDAERFLGLRHMVEHIPLQRQMTVLDRVISSQPRLSVSLNLNQDIDRQMSIRAVAGHLDYWQRVRERVGPERVQVAVRTSGDAVREALASAATLDQIFYIYAHAVAASPDSPSGPDGSALVLTGSQSLTVDDLRLRARVEARLAGAPLVFVNACRSAELSPRFYGGFVPYFVDKGARGVIGTECDTPALFAAEWATRFFDEFLEGGRSLGEVFLTLRRRLWRDEGNLLGLVYALYCDGDTQVVPGLELR